MSASLVGSEMCIRDSERETSRLRKQRQRLTKLKRPAPPGLRNAHTNAADRGGADLARGGDGAQG
eukprot:15187554-Alexandrium_andersonii.AAC.1